MLNKTHQTKYSWEVSEVDLNLRHYSGPVSDVFKKIKHDIITYLMGPNVTDKSKSIYSAIYNALDYYEILSPDFSVDSDFLASSIQTFNEDLEYLSEKYKSDNLFDPPVITSSARVKSPLSFMEKVKDKVNEYIDQNRNFVYFNESLRDIIGVRIVVDPPSSIKSQGLQAESDYVYDVFYNLMTYRGFLENSPTTIGKFKFLNVNTRYDTNKLEKMKLSNYTGKFVLTDRTLTDKEQESIKKHSLLVKPKSRPAYMENIDSKVKDYRLYPKKSGYQSLHTCVVPYYSAYVEKPTLPKCIVPPATSDYTIEYQLRDARENDFSENGPASHNTFKPYEIIYHRLAVPSFIAVDDYRLPNDSLESNHIKLLKTRNFGENYQKFYGPSFEDRFNISYHMFKYTFDEKTQDDILAGDKTVSFDEATNTYFATKSVIPLCVEESDKKSIVVSDNPSSIINFLDNAHLYDSKIVPNERTNSSSSNNKQKKYDNITFLKFSPSTKKNKEKEKDKDKENENDKDNNDYKRHCAAPDFDEDL